MIEAMACGTPVLGLSVGAVPELMEPGVTGCLAGRPASWQSSYPTLLALDRFAVRSRAR